MINIAWSEITKEDFDKLLEIYSKSHKLVNMHFSLGEPPIILYYNSQDGYAIREEKFFMIKKCWRGEADQINHSGKFYKYYYNPHFVIYDRIKHSY